MIKVDGKYYLFNITWPRGDMRTQIVHRADTITGPYEGRVVLRDRGVAQGSIIDTPDGKWYAYLFQDHGAVGRVPFIVPMRWEDGWPVLGVDGKVPMTLEIPAGREGWAISSPPTISNESRRPRIPLGLAVEPQPGPSALVTHRTSRLVAFDHSTSRCRFPERPEHADPKDVRSPMLGHGGHRRQPHEGRRCRRSRRAAEKVRIRRRQDDTSSRGSVTTTLKIRQ
jgi:hypothetical protein